MSTNYFSWLRTGLSTRSEATTDVFGVPTTDASSATVAMSVDGVGRFSRTLPLRGPGDVVSIGAPVIARVEPAPGSRDFPPNLFPYVELSDPALPWTYTPAQANTKDRLIPWVALVVVEATDQTALTALPGSPNMVLRLSADAGAHLPDLSEAFSWGHVEDRLPDGDRLTEADLTSGRLVARLMCPISMKPGRMYIAALVPTFAQGRRVGLGLSPDPAVSGLAWTSQTGALDLPAYYHWRFTTGEADFETLVRRLNPFEVGPDTGLKDLDISRPRGGLSAREIGLPDSPVLVSYAGALTAPEPAPREWDATHKDAFQPALTDFLLPPTPTPSPTNGYSAQLDDPFIGAPVYGSWQAGMPREDTFDYAWMESMNTEPQLRLAGGVGAATVRRHQEEFMGRAWAKARNTKPINDYLRYARLAYACGGVIHTRLEKLPPELLIPLTGPMHRQLFGPDDPTLREISKLPSGALEPGLRRVGKAHVRGPARLTATGEATDIALNGGADALNDHYRPRTDGIVPSRVKLPRDLSPRPGQEIDDLLRDKGIFSKVPAGEGGGGKEEGGKHEDGGKDQGDKKNGKKSEAKDVSTALRQQRDYRVALEGARLVERRSAQRATIVANISAISAQLAAQTLPSAILPQRVASRISQFPNLPPQMLQIPRAISVDLGYGEAFYARIAAHDPELLLPGFGEIPDETVSLVKVNRQTVEAFLVGANHEMSRELAWRGYPAPLNATWFQRFWPYLGSSYTNDISAINSWAPQSALGDHPPSGVATPQSVIMVKGDLMRRYPMTRVYVLRARWQSIGQARKDYDVDRLNPATVTPSGRVRTPRANRDTNTKLPVFGGALGKSANFFGFDISADDLRGKAGQSGWFVVFEQPETEPAFGLDDPGPAQPGDKPQSANDLSWAHFAETLTDLDTLRHATAFPDWQNELIEGYQWGGSSAQTARLCVQSPARIMFHADGLIAETKP